MRAKTAVVYARVSTAKQADEDLPIQGQIEQCKARAEQLDAEVLRVFLDEGISGRDDNRPAFRDAISYCEIYSPHYFICWSTSRFSRNKVDAALYKKRLDRAGTEIVYVSLNIDRRSDSGWMTEGIMELFDEFYSRQIAADTRRSMMKNARDGHWNGGRPPFGYKPEPDPETPKRKRLAPQTEESDVVRRIFMLRADGMGAKSISVLMNDAGIINRGIRWNKKSITALLRNPAVIGQITFGRRDPIHRRAVPRDQWLVVESHEPIIPIELWNSVQTLMDAATNPAEGSPRSSFLFTGMLSCGSCGAPLHIETATGRSRRYEYYNCSRAQEGAGCENRRLPARELDDWLVDEIGGQIFTRRTLLEVLRELQSAVGDWARDQKRRRRELSQQLQGLEDRNRKLYEVLELHGKDAPNLGDITRRLRDNNAQVKRIEGEMLELELEQPPEIVVAEHDIGELSEFLTESIRTAENPAKIRNFLSGFIRDIRIEGDEAVITYDPNLLVVSQQVVHSSGKWLPATDPLRTTGNGRVLKTKLARIAMPERFRRAA